MAKYYNYRHTSTLMFYSGVKVFLDFSDIYTTYLSTKLSHYYLRSYIVKKQVGPMLYCLKLSPTLWRLYLVFLVVKHIAIPADLISRKYFSLSSDLVIIDKKEEWEVEKILNSC